MWTHFWNLFCRSFFYTPAVVSQNWPGVVVAVLIYFGKDIGQIKDKGWRTMILGAKLKKDFYWALGAYVVLFGWEVVHTIYQDHTDLVRKVSSLTPHSELKARVIGSTSMHANKNRDYFALIDLELSNGMGSERPISEWNLNATVDSETFPASPFVLPGAEWKIPNAKDPTGYMTLEERKFCPVVTENPLPSGANRECWFVARFADRDPYFSRRQVTAHISFKDGLTGKTVTLNRIIEEQP
jgi:hypothetical protein